MFKPPSSSRDFDERRSDYQIFRVGSVLILIDSCHGRSVTHDATHVVRELSRSGDFWPEDTLIYHDTTEYRDELVHRDGQFISFVAVRKHALGEALKHLSVE